MSANAWEVAGTEPDAPAAADPWTVAAVEPDSTALARGADADDHASPVARTESRMGDALHTARRFLMGSTPEEEASGDYKVGLLPSLAESRQENSDALERLPGELKGAVAAGTLRTAAGLTHAVSDIFSVQGTANSADAIDAEQDRLTDPKLYPGGVPENVRAQADKMRQIANDMRLKAIVAARNDPDGTFSQRTKMLAKRMAYAAADTLKETQPTDPGFMERQALLVAQSAPTLAGVVAGTAVGGMPGGLAAMAATQGGGSYQDAVEHPGLTVEDRQKFATASAALATVVNAIPLSKAAGPVVGQAAKHFLKLAGMNIGAQEANSVGQHVLAQRAGIAEPLTDDDVAQMTIDSAVQGLAFTGAEAIGGAIRNRNAKQFDLEQTLKDQALTIPKELAAPPTPEPVLPQLEAKLPPDFEVTSEGTVKRPGEEVPEPKALPAPQGSGAFVAGEQGTRELTQADERARQQAREERASLGSDNVTRVPLEALQAIQDGTATKEQVSQARSEGLVSTEGALLPVGRRQIQTLKRAKLQASVTAKTDPQAITVVSGEQGLHGVAIGGKPQAWYSSKQIAMEEAQALRAALPEVKAAAPAVAPKTATVLGQEIEAPATPTAAQAEAGNYKKPVVYWHDMPIKIENVKGSTRTGPLDESGKPAWTHEMAAHYGYIQGSTATDKEGVDVYIGDHKDANKAFVIDQLTPDGKQFDEAKVVIGVKDATAASKLYLDHYPRGWKGLGAITEMNPEKLGEWAYSAAAKQPIAWQKPAEAAVSRYQEHATALKNMAANAGWQEIGGKVITDEDAVKPAVTGRTKWVAKDQQWREAQTVAPLPKNSNGAATKAAVAKATAGERLSASEKRHVDALLDAEQNRHTEEQRFADLNKVSLADIDARIEQLKDLDAILSMAETHESDAEEPLFQRKKPGGQPDLFGDPVAVLNELKRLEAEKDRRRNSGQESVETGKEDDLFSKAKDQKPLFQRSDDDYRGQHTAPDREGGAPLHDVTKNGNYPEDIYSGDGARLYAHYGDSRDYEAIHAIQRVRNRPNRMVKVYRAVPHEQTSAERITQLEKQLARYQRRRIVPNGGRSGFENETAWYEGASKELEELKAQPPQSPARVKINPGDWVTTSRAYAKEHGEDHLGGKYKIISKTVMAKEVFTDANSIFEFGYYPASEAASGEDRPLFQRTDKPSSEIETYIVYEHGSKRKNEIFRSTDKTSVREKLRILMAQDPSGSYSVETVKGAPPDEQPLFQRTDSKLVIQHNTTAEKIAHAHRMGGLAVPSMAITKAERSITGFGDITLLGPKEMADPKGYARTKVFGADVYSPRYPTINYKLDGKALKKLNALLAPFREAAKREIYGGEIKEIDDLTQDDAFKKYAESLGRKATSYHELRELAGTVLREAGASEHIYRGYTNAGNRSYQPHTLENVVKILKKEVRGGEGFSYGVGSLRARYTPQFRSISQIKNEQYRLVPKAQFETIKNEINDDFFKVANELAPYYKHDAKRFGFSDTIIQVFEDAAKMGLPRALAENQFNVVPAEHLKPVVEFLEKLRHLPTEYFEAKILRDVSLSEFRGAVVPKGTDQATLALLKQHGIDVRTYEGDDEARRAVVKTHAADLDVLFRKSDKPAKGQPVAEVKAAVDAILARFKVQPDLHVVANFNDLPAPMLKVLAGQNVKDGDITAFYFKGGVYVIADQIKSMIDIPNTIAHEYIAHLGLRSALPRAEYVPILEGIAKDMPMEVRRRGHVEFGNDFDLKNDFHRQRAAEETLAYYAGEYMAGNSIPERIKRWVQKFIGLLRDWTRDVLGMPKLHDETFLKQLLVDLETHLKSGEGHAQAATEEPAFTSKQPTFYSALTRAAETAKREKGTGKEWLATLKNMPGIKQEEIEATDLEQFLGDRIKISKQEVVDYLNHNGVQVTEKMLGDEPLVTTEQVHEGSMHETRFLVDGKPVDYPRINQLPDGNYAVYWQSESQSKEAPDYASAHAMAMDLLHDDQPQGTRYSQYTLPGGEHYRELLLTLPTSTGLPAGWKIVKHPMGLAAEDSDGDIHATGRTEQEVIQKILEYGNKGIVKTGAYRHEHWAESNVLAHIRFDERTDSDGKRVMHIAEIQSDWHQTGRKKGYAGSLPDNWEIIPMSEWGKLPKSSSGDGYVVVDTNTGISALGTYGFKTAEDAKNEALAQRAAHGVPDAPFKTTWPELSLKRAIRFASENGFDRISWDSGATNAERYDLSKQVNGVRVMEATAADTVHVLVQPKGNTQWTHIAEGNSAVKRNGLADAIGKELAEKALKKVDAGEIAEFHGLDLKVGGEGQKGFYDRIVPTATKRLVKKYGAQLSESRLNDADAVTEEDRHTRPIAAAVAAGELPILGFDITDAMRSAAMEGQPLFQRTTGRMDDLFDERNRLDEERDRRRAVAREASTPQFPARPNNAYEVARRIVAAIPNNEFIMSFRRGIDPSGVSEVAKSVANLTRASLGELAYTKHEAIQNLERYAAAMDKLSPADQLQIIDDIENGRPQSVAGMQPAANAMRQMTDEWRDKIRALGQGYLDNYIENYFPHYWQDESKAAKLVGMIAGRRPLRGPATFLKQRTVPTVKDGMSYGLRPLSINPLILSALKLHEMQRFYAGVKLMQKFKEAGLARFLRSGQPTPEGWGEINDAVGRVRQWSEAEKGFIERGKYIMPTDGARVINNHLSASALRNFLPAQVFRAASNMLNALQLGFSGFHLGFTTLDAMISKNALGIERLAHGEPLRAAAAFLEGSTPVGAVLNLYRGQKLLRAYSNIADATPEMAAQVKMLQHGGGRVSMDRYFMAAQGVSPFHGVGLTTLARDVKAALTGPERSVTDAAKAIGSFPLSYATKLWRDLQSMAVTYPAWQIPFEAAGRITRASTSIIMEKIVPLQKLGVFSDMASDYLRRHPAATPEESMAAMQTAWQSVDNRLGEMVYDNLFWNRTFKDILHFMIRAVGWNYGTISEIAGAPVDAVKMLDKTLQGKLKANDLGHKIPYVMAMTGTTMLFGAILNYLFTGKPPDEPKDYFFPRTGGVTRYGTPERVSLPSYAKDVFEYSQEPGQTMLNKLNPIFNIISEIWKNEDFFGNAIYDPEATDVEKTRQALQHVGREATPFSLQGAKQIHGSEQDTTEGKVKTALPFIGITPAPGRITSPDEMETARAARKEQSYAAGLKYRMKDALEHGDADKARELMEQYKAARLRARHLTVETKKDKAKGTKAQREQKREGEKTSMNDLTLLPITDSASKREAVRTILDAGHPALAALVDTLPVKLRPMVAAALREGRVNA